MKRIREIINDVRSRYPDDNFFSDFEQTYRISELKRKYYQSYNRVVRELDDKSWQVLRDKALSHFKNHRNGQKKQGFFNQLNEAFAYRYLLKNGCGKILFLEEDGNKKPDLEYFYNNVKGYCEVKTLGISDKEISRRGSQTVCDGQVYFSLDGGFLNKFHQAVDDAWEQIHAMGQEGIVYIIIIFDDMTLDHYPYYRKQLINYSKKQGFNKLFIKIWLLGRKRICISSQSI